MDEKKVVISFRIDPVLRDLVGSWAKEERRTMANFMEDLIHREQERREGKEITLEDVYRSINTIKQQFDKFSENKKKNYTNKDNKLTAYDAWELVDGEEICTRENWNKWIDHLHKLGVHLTPYAGELQFNNLKDIWYEDKDCDLIINHIIKQGHKKLYVPKS